MSRKREFFTSTGVSLMKSIEKLTDQEKLSLMRRCQKCKDLKHLDDFFSRTSAKFHRSSYCKSCFVVINNEYKKNNKEKIKKIKKKEYEKNKERYLNGEYKRKYGITIEVFKKMENEQNFVCAICHQQNGSRRLCVDHCHKTKKIRELLCANCNSVIGQSMEDPKILLKCIEYLKKHS